MVKQTKIKCHTVKKNVALRIVIPAVYLEVIALKEIDSYHRY